MLTIQRFLDKHWLAILAVLLTLAVIGAAIQATKPWVIRHSPDHIEIIH